MIEQEEQYDLFGEVPPAVVDKNQEIKNSFKVHNVIIKRFTSEIFKPLFLENKVDANIMNGYNYRFASDLDLYNFHCCFD